MTEINSQLNNFYIQRSYKASERNLSTLIERLSSGCRINSAKDNAVGLSITTNFETQISGTKVANDNIQQGIDFCNTADASLSSITEQLQKLRDLAVQAANGTYSDEEREILQNEADSIIDGVYQTKETSTYNNTKVFGEEVTIGIERGQGYKKVKSKTAEELDAEYGAGKWIAVNTRAELNSIRFGSSGKTFVLMSDIDLSDADWSSFGLYGTLDGNGYTISNLHGTLGLFWKTEGATIKNLELTNVEITIESGGTVGSLVGLAGQTSITNCAVINSVINYSNTAGASGNHRVGGLIGQLGGSSTAENCYADIELNNNCTNGAAGGLVGFIDNGGIVKNCYSTGTITGYSGGGLVGCNWHGGTISNCYSSANIDTTTSTAGGLVADNYGTITKSYATGNVTSDSGFVGGLCGGTNAAGKISYCYATGDVGSNGLATGGLFGHCYSKVSNSYSTGNVTGRKSVGGIAGHVRGATIENCYSTGNITGTGVYTGGIVGNSANGGVTIKNSYATGNIAGIYGVGGIIGDLGGTDEIIENCISSSTVSRSSGTNKRFGSLYGGASDTSNIKNNYTKEQNFGFVGTTQVGTTEEPSEWFNNTDNWKVLGDAYDYYIGVPTLNMGNNQKTSIQITANSTNEDEEFNINSAFNLGNISVNFSSSENANASIGEIDALLNKINQKRSSIGTTSSILSSIQTSNQIRIENMEASKSTIMDTDYAKATAEFTKQQILQQTCASLLAQSRNINRNYVNSIINGMVLNF